MLAGQDVYGKDVYGKNAGHGLNVTVLVYYKAAVGLWKECDDHGD